MKSLAVVIEYMNEAITDIADHYSTKIRTKDYKEETFYFVNSLNQAVTVQTEASYNEAFTDKFDVGAAFPVGIGAKIYQTLSEPHPFVRFKVTAGVAPATGTMKIVASMIGV